MADPTANHESGVPAEDYLCSRIRRAEQALMGHHEAVLRGHGLTMTQYTVLLALSAEGDMSGAQLARACGVTQQTMATVLTGLQKKELIARTPSPVHAKVLLTSLTDQGRTVLDRAYQEVIVLERALSDAFTPEQHAALCALLERATEVLVQQTPRRR
ncbi:MarR family winged helix-turn-helix transcriptional regulator [Streptomyces cyanogenus]|uniref:HTH-type transcriptional regulator SarZ n=1 Tax=Streptomyces cyanogenus TaxID=80860 RepID=A0ABX7U6M2_STRCY|nr:MarR family transcriptional regulator [Streptomyces cyanogenus]QTE02990.1 HTH-type transcriptional regulator SarZ [Streptomyces cyanogenus]